MICFGILFLSPSRWCEYTKTACFYEEFIKNDLEIAGEGKS